MYGKLFASMFTGSLHGHWQAIITFQQMIILADQDGTIEMTAAAISSTTSIPLDIIEAGISLLESPDPDSRTPGEAGRRITRINPERSWGWHITNHAHYRAIRTAMDRREYHKQYWHKRKTQQNSTDSTGTQQNQPIAEAEAEADTVNQLHGHFSNEKSAPVGDKEEKEPVPFSKIVDLYHEKLPELPRCVKLTNQRKGYIRQRWQEDLPDMEEWGKYFEIVKQSKFLLGKVKGSDNRPPFRADLAWLCKPENIVKIIEGKYHRG